jgi:hypothetical protein
MANTFLQVGESDFSFINSGVVLSASQTITADGNSASLEVGKGRFDIKFNLTVEDVPLTSANNYMFYIEANKKSALTTWVQLACLPVNGVVIDGVGNFQISFRNPFDHEIRLRWVEAGISSITFDTSVHPVII